MFHLYDKINNNEIYFIAEMSANHGGSLDNALRIVREAKDAGADCLKIQTYNADTMTIDCDKPDFGIEGGLWDGYKLYDLYTDASTPYEWQGAIKAECEKAGIDFLSTPFDKTSVDFLEELGVEAYKIASYELVDIPLIKYVASKQKPMIISVGMGSIEEIHEAEEACLSQGNEQIVLLKCCSEYPSPWAEMKLHHKLSKVLDRLWCSHSNDKPTGLWPYGRSKLFHTAGSVQLSHNQYNTNMVHSHGG